MTQIDTNLTAVLEWYCIAQRYYTEGLLLKTYSIRGASLMEKLVYAS